MPQPKTGSSPGLRHRHGAADDETESKATFSWKEVAEHNTLDSCWVIYDNKVYDVTSFVGRHPGGREVLMLAAGRDITHILPSYHPFTSKPQEILQKFEIGACIDSEFPRYQAADGEFYQTLRKRVAHYFEETGKDPRSPWPSLFRTTPALVCLAATFCLMHGVPVALPWSVRLLLAVIHGICQVLPMLHVMHDACHCAVGHSPVMWGLLGRLTMNITAGVSYLSWQHQHVVGHHVYTNVYEVDPDIPFSKQGDPRYIVPRQSWCSLYRYQHWYLPLLYGLLGIQMRIADITFMWMQNKNGPIRVNWWFAPWVEMGLWKSLWVLHRFILPLFVWNTPAAEFWTLLLVSELFSGFWLAFNFEVSHVSEDAEFFHSTDDTVSDSVSKEWAVSQVRSSVNYRGNWLVDYLAGALNYQTEHHLFPSVSQYHYPSIAPIVEATCRDFGVKYNTLSGFWAAFGKHWSHLKRMSERGIPAHVG